MGQVPACFRLQGHQHLWPFCFLSLLGLFSILFYLYCEFVCPHLCLLLHRYTPSEAHTGVNTVPTSCGVSLPRVYAAQVTNSHSHTVQYNSNKKLHLFKARTVISVKYRTDHSYQIVSKEMEHYGLNNEVLLLIMAACLYCQCALIQPWAETVDMSHAKSTL